MIEKLVELLESYSKEGKYADDKFIMNAIDIIVSYKELDKYVFDVIFYDENRHSLEGDMYASCSITKFYPEKGIHINSKQMKVNIIQELLENHGILAQFIPSNFLDSYCVNEVLCYQYNIKTLFILLHQIERVKQFANYGKRNDFESMLVDLNLKLLVRYEYYKGKAFDINNDVIKKIPVNIDKSLDENEEYTKAKFKLNNYYNDVYRKNIYQLEPINRFSNIKSIDILISIINECDIEDELKKILIDINRMYKYYYSFESYSSNLNPLGFYVDYMNSIGELSTENLDSDEIKSRIQAQNNRLGLFGKVYYGLGITEEERTDIQKNKIKIL